MSFFHSKTESDRCIGTTLDFLHTKYPIRPPDVHRLRLYSISWNCGKERLGHATNYNEFAVFFWPIRIYLALRLRPWLYKFDILNWAKCVRSQKKWAWDTNGFTFDVIARRKYLEQELAKMEEY